MVFGSHILVTTNLDRKLVVLDVREYTTVPSSSSSSSETN